MAFRTYQERVSKNEAWKIAELIEIAKYNGGDVVVDKDGKQFLVQIHEIVDKKIA